MKTRHKTSQITNTQIFLGVLGLFFATSLAFIIIPFQPSQSNKKPISKVEQKKSITSPPSAVFIQKKEQSQIDFKKVIDNNKQLQQKILSLKKSLQTNEVFLVSILDSAEKQLQNFTIQILQASSPLEKQRVLHLQDHRRIPDQVSYVEKMKNLPESLSNLSSLIKKNETILKNLSKEKSLSTPLSPYLEIQKILEKYLPQLENQAKINNYTKIDSTLKELRKKIIPLLLSSNTTLPKFNSKSLYLLRELIDSQQNIYSQIELRLPPPLNLDTDLPNRLSSSMPSVVNAFVCITSSTNSLGEPILTDDEIRQAIERTGNIFRDISLGNSRIILGDIIHTEQQANNPQLLDFYEHTARAIQLCDPSIDFLAYDLMIVYPSAFTSTAASDNFLTAEGEKRLGVVIMNNFNNNSLQHEIGHASFYLQHANYLFCHGNSFLANLEGCQIREYDTIYDVMGLNDISDNIGGWNRRLAELVSNSEWINLRDIQQDGVYTLHTLTVNTNQPRFLRIPFQDHPVCIEYRKRHGPDEDLHLSFREFPQLEGIPEQGGLLIYLCYDNEQSNGGDGSLLYRSEVMIDTSPQRGDFFDKVNSLLHEGEQFANLDLGIQVSWQQGQEENTAEIQLDVDETKF